MLPMGNKKFTKDEGVIPFIRVMQPLSPQVNDAGISPGGFLNLATNKYSKDLLVVPVDVRWNYTEWSAPQGEGGQFVRDWGENDKGWQDLCEGSQKFAYQPVTKDGHVILIARHFYIFDINAETGEFERCIFPLYATGLKIAKAWSTMLQFAPKVATSRGMMTPAFFYYTYVVTLDEVKNTRNQRWFQVKINPNIVDNKYIPVMDLPNGKAIWDAAVRLREDLTSGVARAESQVESEEGY